MTCVFAATTGLVQNDLKRVIAYSTASQLGYMVFACGLSQYALGIFHLMNHAFFKALLFLSAGCVIHALGDEQDMRRMGGVVRLLPLTYAMMVVGSLALVGIPFLTGFYSKDVILEVAASTYTLPGRVSWLFGSLVVCLTATYSFRLLLMTFLTPSASGQSTLRHVHEAPPLLALPLVPLALGSVGVGYVAKEMMIGLGTPFWSQALVVLPDHVHGMEAEMLPQSLKLLPLGAILLGALVAWGTQCLWPRGAVALAQSAWGRGLLLFFSGRWFVDRVYSAVISMPLLRFGYETSFKALDKGVLEMLGPWGIVGTLRGVTEALSALQNGRLSHYALVMLLTLTMALSLLSLWPLLETSPQGALLLVCVGGFLWLRLGARSA